MRYLTKKFYLFNLLYWLFAFIFYSRFKNYFVEQYHTLLLVSIIIFLLAFLLTNILGAIIRKFHEMLNSNMVIAFGLFPAIFTSTFILTITSFIILSFFNRVYKLQDGRLTIEGSVELFTILAIDLSIWIFLFLLVDRIKNRKKTQDLKSDIDVKIQELQLDFFRNKISHLIFKRNLKAIKNYSLFDVNESKKMIKKFSENQKYIYSNYLRPKIILKDELILLKNLLSFYRLRFKKVKFNFFADCNFQKTLIPPMIFQTVIETFLDEQNDILEGKVDIYIAEDITKKKLNISINHNLEEKEDNSKEIFFTNLKKRLGILYNKKFSFRKIKPGMNKLVNYKIVIPLELREFGI